MSLKTWNERRNSSGRLILYKCPECGFMKEVSGLNEDAGECPRCKIELIIPRYKMTWDETGIKDGDGNPVISFEKLLKSSIKTETPKPDMVNHPPHYTRGKVETIDGLESAVEGLQGKEAGLTWQVIRYMWRWKFKNNPLEDLKKAEFYLKRLIKHVEEEK